jgi:hypothetical protein
MEMMDRMRVQKFVSVQLLRFQACYRKKALDQEKIIPQAFFYIENFSNSTVNYA